MIDLVEDMYGPLKQRLASKGIEGICLDIDDTLGATNEFWASHLIENFGNPEHLTAEEIISKYRFASSVPYWGNNAEAEQWILDNCNSPLGRLDVLPTIGSVEGVRNIQKIMPVVAYLTGRTCEIEMGTKQWLNTHTFPECDLLSQPSAETLKQMNVENTHEWKSKVLEFLYPNIAGIVEDNDNIIECLSPTYEGTVFLYSHESTSRTDIDIACCPTWDTVVREVLERKKEKSTKLISSAYNSVAGDFLDTRTKRKGPSGFGHREIEQPNMFDLVPSDLTGVKLLDLGCGPGIHSKEYLQRGAELSGYDISAEMIQLAKIYAPGGNFEVRNAYDLGEQNNNFDIVTSSLLLDHIINLDDVFAEVKRVLKPGGEFIFSIPHPMLSLFDSASKSKVTSSYFNTTPHHFSVAGNPTLIEAYHHQLMDYFQVPLSKGFSLNRFVENQPSPDWIETNPNIDKSYLLMPQQCFFSWSNA